MCNVYNITEIPNTLISDGLGTKSIKTTSADVLSDAKQNKATETKRQSVTAASGELLGLIKLEKTHVL